MLRNFLVSVLLWVGLALAAPAQTQIDYAAWDATAKRAQSVLETAAASTEALEDLRATIARYRAEFLAAQSENGQRIATIEAQIEALGPVPESGTEPEDIAARRAELSAQLAALKAPILRAEAAYTEAEGLIREIDSVIRERQKDALLELGRSPLLPQLWPAAVEEATRAVGNLGAEFERAWNAPAKRAELKANLPLILALVLFALVVLVRGRWWMERLSDRLRRLDRQGANVWGFLASLGQIAMPFLGLIALSQAAGYSGMLDLRGRLLVESLPVWGGSLLFLRWLADQSFARDDSVATLPLDSWRRTEGRVYFMTLGLLLVLQRFLVAMAELEKFDAETLSVLSFPILLVAGLLLFRLGQLLSGLGQGGAQEDGAPSEAVPFRVIATRLLGRAAMIVGIVGPAMAAIGYANAGSALTYPSILTLCLFATVLVLQRFIGDVYALLAGKSPAESDSLVPVLAGFVLSLLALPVAALIWGARVADLTEVWMTFAEGIQLGETRIRPGDFLVFAIVFAVGYALTRLLQTGLRNSVLPKTRMDTGAQNAVVAGVGYLGIFLAALFAITSAGLDLSSLAIVAGALSVGIGFGLQNIVSNFVSGIILLIERPISEGDWIEVGGQQGYVRDISVRSTRIETFDRTDVIVPNADLVSGTVTNFTRGNTIGRVIVPVGVAYGSDTRKVQSILLNIAREHDMVLMNPEPGVDFLGFGADSMDFRIRCILRDVTAKVAVATEMNHRIVEEFEKHGIEIPFAQRDIWLRNPEALAGAVAAAKPKGGETA